MKWDATTGQPTWTGKIMEVLALTSTSERRKTEGYLAHKWGILKGSRPGQDGTVRIVRPQVSALAFTSGTLTIDTDKAEIAHTDGSYMLGEYENKTYSLNGKTYTYKVSKFTADNISIGSGVVVNLVGTNPLSLQTRNNGDLTLGSTINANGGAGTEGPNTGGVGKLGGYDGGTTETNGDGPGAGSAFSPNFAPDVLNSLELWLDASSLVSAGSTWTDSSGNGNYATKNGSPAVVSNSQNGHSIMRYSGADGDYHEWTDLNDIRTIFWVIKAESTNGGFLLGDDNRYDFHHNQGNPPNFWHGSHASANVRNGNLSINGTRNISGTSTAINASLSNLIHCQLENCGKCGSKSFQ